MDRRRDHYRRSRSPRRDRDQRRTPPADHPTSQLSREQRVLVAIERQRGVAITAAEHVMQRTQTENTQRAEEVLSSLGGLQQQLDNITDKLIDANNKIDILTEHVNNVEEQLEKMRKSGPSPSKPKDAKDNSKKASA